MVALTAHLALHVAILSTSGIPTRTYEEAYKRAVDQRQPLLVLVGSESSQAYKDLRVKYLPSVKVDESIGEVVLAVVDRDQRPELAKELVQSAVETQLVLYTHDGDQWQRITLPAPKSPTEVHYFLKRNILMTDTIEPDFVPVQWGSS